MSSAGRGGPAPPSRSSGPHRRQQQRGHGDQGQERRGRVVPHRCARSPCACRSAAAARPCRRARTRRLATVASTAAARPVGMRLGHPCRAAGRRADRRSRRVAAPARTPPSWRRRPRRSIQPPSTRPSAADQLGMLGGQLNHHVAAPRLPDHDRPVQPELGDDRGQVGRGGRGVVAVLGRIGLAVAAQVDRVARVGGRRSATSSHSRALEDRPCTSRIGAPDALRGAGRSGDIPGSTATRTPCQLRARRLAAQPRPVRVRRR